MEAAAKSKLIKIAIKVISVLLTVVFTLSVLGAVAISGVRHFFKDGEFESIVNGLDLNEVKFQVGGSTYTASDYIYESLIDYLPQSIQNYTGMLAPFMGNMVSSTIKNIVSSEAVDKIAKETIMDCVDFYLESDSKEAKERIDNNKVSKVKSPDFENAETYEDAIKIYMRSLVLGAVENTTEISSDYIIVLLSEGTCNLLIAVSVISAILIVICNLGSLISLPFFFGSASLIFGAVIKILQSKFESAQTDKTLIGYEMLKPLADSFSGNAVAGIFVGVTLIAIFLVLVIFLKPKEQSKA